jgi:hypothetical protein
MVPAASRLADVHQYVARGFYFVVHAPRQTGKTTTLQALFQEIAATRTVAALHFSCEAAQAAGEDFGMAELLVLRSIQSRADIHLPEELRPPASWIDGPPGSRLNVALSAWAKACPLPLALVFDEIDSLQGNSLISVLRQLRAGYLDRPKAFPSSVILCGLKDVRDYKMASGGDASRLGTASPFNIKVESIKLASFTKQQVHDLCLQHTEETGQAFDHEALDLAFELTQGQPWLVNALAREVVEKMKVPLSVSITARHIDQAKERLILARATHIDSLVSNLQKTRVRRLIEPIMNGSLVLGVDSYNDDVLYLRDLGLIAPGNPLQIANPIYREVIVRVLATYVEEQLVLNPRSFILPDGRLDMNLLVEEFLTFWKEHGEILATGTSYHEVAPQLVLMAFLQRIVNGGGYVEREYGVGRGRIDLMVKWPYQDQNGKHQWQREAFELKVWRGKMADPLYKGLVQLDDYLTRLSLDQGYLVIFDRRKKAALVDERTKTEQALTPSDRPVVVIRA